MTYLCFDGNASTERDELDGRFEAILKSTLERSWHWSESVTFDGRKLALAKAKQISERTVRR